jgi:hypothetical protein
MKKTIADKLDYADEFYRQPYCLDLWRDTCDPCRLRGCLESINKH